MSYLGKLLEGVAVEWKPIEEIITDKFWLMPSTPKFDEDEEIPYITSKNIKGGHINFDKIKFISRTDYSNLSRNRGIKPGDILISMIGTIGEVAIVKETDLDFYGQNMYLIRLNRNIVSADYFLHFFDSPKVKYHFNSVKNNKGQGYLKANDIESLPIPIPCPESPKKSLEYQQKIVDILDKFTQLTAELIAELTTRKQQYEYYREQLFRFDEKDVEHLPMGDDSIGRFQRGKRFVKDDIMLAGVPCIHYGEMYTHYGIWANKSKSFLSVKLVEDKKLRIAENGDVVIVAAGETIEDLGKGTAWLGEEGVIVHDACFSYQSIFNPKYVAYFTRTKQYHDQIKKHISSGKISAIHANGLGKVLIPVASPDDQDRIVSILDKFNVLTSSISEGLPKEITLRKKQYEYYRDLLLTFPKDSLTA